MDLDLDEFCTPELQKKMKPAKDLLRKQLAAKEEAEVEMIILYS